MLHSTITPEQIQRLTINRWFGCLTRGAFELTVEAFDRWQGVAVVYFDIDNLKRANEQWGKAESSRRIREALAWRASDIGAWFSGDEFVALIPVSDALGFARRIQSELEAREMSATIVILTSARGPEDIDRAETLVSAAKTQRRGAIYLR